MTCIGANRTMRGGARDGATRRSRAVNDGGRYADNAKDTMSTATAIEMRDVSLSYGKVRALQDVCLTVERGEIVGYLGPNGAGKTSTIRILAGLTRPGAGEALVAGHSVQAAPLEVKARIGFVPESGAVFEKFSAREYLTMSGRLHRLPQAELGDRIHHWIGRFGLGDALDRQLATLSKGMRQKVCWIGALLHDPEVLILDEPLNGLDVETIALVQTLMQELAAAGRTIFYSSHLVDLVERVCTRVAILHQGRLVAWGAIDEVVAALAVPSLEDALLTLARG
jgi:ABC-2 type transport system ATP-binding protein